MRITEYSRTNYLTGDQVLLIDGDDSGTKIITALNLAKQLLALLGAESGQLSDFYRVRSIPNGVTDLNGLTENGLYPVNSNNTSMTNLPIAHTGFIENRVQSSNYGYQTFVDRNNGTVYRRIKNSGNWGDWTVVGVTGLDDRLNALAATDDENLENLTTLINSRYNSLNDGKLNVSNDAEISNLNNLTQNGFYRYSSDAINKPASTTAGGSVIVTKFSDDYIHQLAFPNSSSATNSPAYVRMKNKNGWQSWYMVCDVPSLDSAVSSLTTRIDTKTSELSLSKMDVNPDAETSNLNNLKTNGFYHYSGDVSNNPRGSGSSLGGSVIVSAFSTGWVHQVAFVNYAASVYIYVRVYGNNSWSAWSKLPMPEDLDNISSQLAGKMDVETAAETSNLNNLKTNGFYHYSSSASNKPTGTTKGGSLIVSRFSANDIYQVAFMNSENDNDAPIYVRHTMGNGVFPSTWYKVTLTKVTT